MGRRWLKVSDTDHAAHLWIAVLLLLGISTVAAGTRLCLRRRSIGDDDVALFLAQILTWGSGAAFIVSLVNGLGKSADLVEPSDLQVQADALRAAQLLFIGAAALARTSVIFLIERIFTREFRACKYVLIGLTAINATWCLSSLIAIAGWCSPLHIFSATPAAACRDDATRWQAVIGADCALEVWVAILPGILLSQIPSIPLRHRLLASAAFLSRLPSIALLISFAISYTRWTSHYDKATSRLILPLILQQSYLCWTLLSASIPFARSFARACRRNSITAYAELPWLERLRHNSRSSAGVGSKESHVTAEDVSKPEVMREDSKQLRPLPRALASVDLKFHTRTHWTSSPWRRPSSDTARPSSNTRPGTSSPPSPPPREVGRTSVATMNDESPGGMKLRPEIFESWTNIYHSDSPPRGNSVVAANAATAKEGGEGGEGEWRIRKELRFDLAFQ